MKSETSAARTLNRIDEVMKIWRLGAGWKDFEGK